MPSHLLADSYVAVCSEDVMGLADSSCDNPSGLFQVWYMRALSIKLTTCKHITVNRNRNSRHNGRLWKLTIEHTDHVTRLLDVPEYQRVSIEEWATYLFDKKMNHCSARTLACVSYVNSVGSSVPQ